MWGDDIMPHAVREDGCEDTGSRRQRILLGATGLRVPALVGRALCHSGAMAPQMRCHEGHVALRRGYR